MGTGFSFETEAHVNASPLLGGADPTVTVLVSTLFENFEAAACCSVSRLNPPLTLTIPE